MRLILQKRMKYLRTFTLFRVRNSSPYILLNTISTITEKKISLCTLPKKKKNEIRFEPHAKWCLYFTDTRQINFALETWCRPSLGYEICKLI